MIVLTITETNNSECPMIGTLSAHGNKELNDKVVLACERHFDSKVRLSRILTISEFKFKYPSTMSILADGEEHDITIQETWLY